MANILNVSLNLLSGGSFRKAAGDVKILNSTLGTANGILEDFKKKMDFRSKMASFASASVLVSNFTSGVKSAIGAVESLVGVVGKFAKTGDRIAKTSRLVGLSVNDYQAFDAAAQHAGMSTEELDSALKKFSVNLGKARGGDKTAFRVFDSILGGRRITEFKDSTELLKGIADGYSKLATAEQKAFVSQELFGRSGLKMSEMLSSGGTGVQKMLDDFAAIGGGFTEEGAKNAEAFDDALQDMRGTINSVKISVMQELFPTFTEMFKTIQAFVKDNGPKIREQVGFVVGSVGNLVKGLLPSIPKILNVVVKLVDLIGPGVLAALAGFTGILGVVVPLVPSLMAAASVVSGPIVAGIGLAVVGFVAWKKAISSVIDNFDMLKSFIYDDIGGAIKNFANQFVEVAKWMWSGFKSIFIDPWWNFFTALPGAISDLWDGFKTGISEIGNLLYDTFIGSVKSAVSGIKSIVKGIPVLGNLFGDDEQPSIRDISSASAAPGSSSSSLGASVAQAVSESHTTTTSRFAVDFKNMPRGVQVTAPDHGDFDYSRGYVLAGM